MKKQPELSVITVNYNGLRDTERMIESLQKHLTIQYELIVVDNGSVRDEASELQLKYPFLITIRSEQNLGFAGGNNLGIKHATSEYLFFLNNDTFVQDDFFSCLIDAMKQNPFLGGLSPKIIFADSEQGIQFAGYTPLSRITLRNHLIGFRQQDTGQFDKPHPTPYLHGAAMLIRRKAIENAGMMPEIYFLYYEELDWSVQIRRAGYELEYNPSATVYHLESSSTGQESPLKAFYMTRNRLLFAQRNLSGTNRILSVSYQLLFAVPVKLLQALLTGRIILAKAMIRGCLSFITMHLN